MTDLTTEDTVYVTYIATTPEKVWATLTSSEFTRQYFFGRSVESDWKKGSPWTLRMTDGRIDVKGEVRESDPPRKLVLSWTVDWNEELRKLPEAVVSYEIEPIAEDRSPDDDRGASDTHSRFPAGGRPPRLANDPLRTQIAA